MKTKQYSLKYWVKQRGDDKTILDLIQKHKAGQDLPIVWDGGSTLSLANALYAEWGKRHGSWYQGFYPTPMEIATLEIAERMNLQPGQVILDPGCGFGNLSVAAHLVQPEIKVVAYEHNQWIYSVAETILAGEDWIDLRRGDFLDEFTNLPAYDAVIMNPPFGNVYGYVNAEIAFLHKVARGARQGTRVAAILPPLAFEVTARKLSKKYAVLGALYHVDKILPLPEGAFRPLTSVQANIYLLTVSAGGLPVIKSQPPKVEIDPFVLNQDEFIHWRDQAALTWPQKNDITLHRIDQRCPHPFKEHAWSKTQRRYICLNKCLCKGGS